MKCIYERIHSQLLNFLLKLCSAQGINAFMIACNAIKNRNAKLLSKKQNIILHAMTSQPHDTKSNPVTHHDNWHAKEEDQPLLLVEDLFSSSVKGAADFADFSTEMLPLLALVFGVLMLSGRLCAFERGGCIHCPGLLAFLGWSLGSSTLPRGRLHCGTGAQHESTLVARGNAAIVIALQRL